MSIGTLQVESVAVEGQQNYGEQPFPLTLACRGTATLETATTWIAGNNRQLSQQAAQHGAILFRGFPLTGPEDFDHFIAAFGLPNFRYEDSLSNAVRVDQDAASLHRQRSAGDRNDLPAPRDGADADLSEQAVLLLRAAAESGGATPLCRSDVLWERLRAECPAFARDCESKGLPTRMSCRRTTIRAPAWDAAGRARCVPQRQDEAEARLKGLGYSWTWLPDGCSASDNAGAAGGAEAG